MTEDMSTDPSLQRRLGQIPAEGGPLEDNSKAEQPTEEEIKAARERLANDNEGTDATREAA